MERFCKVAILFLLAPALALGQWQIGQRSFHVGGAAPTTPAWVQSAYHENSGSNTFSITVSTTAGNDIYVVLFGGTSNTGTPSDPTTANFSDSASNTYISDVVADSDTSSRVVGIFHCHSCAAITSVSFTQLTTPIFAIYGADVVEISGSGSVDATGTGTNVYGNYSSLTAPITTTATNELLISGALDIPNTSTLSGATWTLRDDVSGASATAQLVSSAPASSAGGYSFTASYPAQFSRPTAAVVSIK